MAGLDVVLMGSTMEISSVSACEKSFRQRASTFLVYNKANIGGSLAPYKLQPMPDAKNENFIPAHRYVPNNIYPAETTAKHKNKSINNLFTGIQAITFSINIFIIIYLSYQNSHWS